LICFKDDYPDKLKIIDLKNKLNEEKYALFNKGSKIGTFVFAFSENIDNDIKIQNAINENCQSLLYQYPNIPQAQSTTPHVIKNVTKTKTPVINNGTYNGTYNTILLQGVSTYAIINYENTDYSVENFIQYRSKVKQDLKKSKSVTYNFANEKIKLNGIEKILKETVDISTTIKNIEKIEKEKNISNGNKSNGNKSNGSISNGNNENKRINETCLLFKNMLFELKTGTQLDNIDLFKIRNFECFVPLDMAEYDIYSYYYDEVTKIPLENFPIEFVQLVHKGGQVNKNLEKFHYEYFGNLQLNQIKELLKEKNGPQRSVITGDILDEADKKMNNTNNSTGLLSKGKLFRYNKRIYVNHSINCKGATDFPPPVEIKPTIMSPN